MASKTPSTPVRGGKLERTEPQDFTAFAEWALRELHDALITGGSKAMLARLHMVLPYYKNWQERVDATLKAAPRKRR